MNTIKPRKLNHLWDSLLTPEQKQILVSQGFGFLHELPYIEAERVKEIMETLENCLKEIEEMIKQS